MAYGHGTFSKLIHRQRLMERLGIIPKSETSSPKEKAQINNLGAKIITAQAKLKTSQKLHNK